jgi:hypothetical protein
VTKYLRATAVLLFSLFLPNVAFAKHCVKISTRAPASVSGVINGVPVTVVLYYDGTNGGPSGASAFWLDVGGNGLRTNVIKIAPQGQYGDRIGVFFANSYMYVSNAVYLPGQAHCCYTNRTVQRFRMDISDSEHPKLVAAGLVNVPLPPEPHYAVPSSAHACPPDSYDDDFARSIRSREQRAILDAPYPPQ